MTQRPCPVCKTAVPEDADLCPECGWEIDRSTGELIIGDPVELQQDAERKQRKLQHYRWLYQQAQQVEGLAKQVAGLKQDHQTAQEKIATLEAWQQRMLNLRRLRSEPRTVSDKDGQAVFQVDKKRRPLQYVANDFEVQGPVIFDHATGLMWQQSGSQQRLPYVEAQTYIDQLNHKQFAGYADWRLPTINELLSLMTAMQENGTLHISRIFDTSQPWCWSIDKRSLESAWIVSFIKGVVDWFDFLNLGYVRAVRS